MTQRRFSYPTEEVSHRDNSAASIPALARRRCLRMSSVRRCDTNRADTQKRARRPQPCSLPSPLHTVERVIWETIVAPLPRPCAFPLRLSPSPSPLFPSPRPSPRPVPLARPSRCPALMQKETPSQPAPLNSAPGKSGVECAVEDCSAMRHERLAHNSLQMTAQNAPRTIQRRDSPHNSPQLPPSLPRATECRAHCLPPRPLSATFCGVPALPSRARAGRPRHARLQVPLCGSAARRGCPRGHRTRPD